jgi:hypothetical protein
VRAISSPTAEGGITGRISGLGGLAVRLSWPFRPALLDVGWAAFSAVNLIAIFAFAGWETIPFHFIWISFTLVYGFRTWAPGPTLAVLGVVMATTGAAIGVDVARGTESVAELTEVPLMAAMFLAMVWHARRKLTRSRSRAGSARRTPGCSPPSAGSSRTPRTSSAPRSRSRSAMPNCWPAT